jgi:tetratricopeptide (TPR) repeat protein
MRGFVLVVTILVSSLICGYVSTGSHAAANASSIESLTLQTKRDPQDGWAYYRLCEAYINNEQYKEAIAPCQKASQATYRGPQSPNVPRLFHNLGVAYYRTGQTNEAIAARKTFVELLPNEPAGYNNLAQAYNQNKQYEEAITAAKRATELKPDYADAYGELGIAYGNKGKFTEAIGALKTSLRLGLKQPGVFAYLGPYLEKTGKQDEAAQVYADGIKQGADLGDRLASLQYRMARYDAAIATATEAIEQRTVRGIGVSFYVQAGYPVVKGVMNRGPAKKADMQTGDKILEVDGKSTEGWTLEKVTQAVNGTVGTQVVLTIERNDNKIKKTVAREAIVQEGAAVSMALRSLAYRSKGDLGKAANEAQAAMDLAPSAPSDEFAFLALGAACLDRGQYDEAIRLLSKVNGSPVAAMCKATALAKKGRTEEAVQVYLSVPDVSMSQKHVPLAKARQALLEVFKPVVKANMDKARSFKGRNMHREALSALSEALKMADDSDAQAIQEGMFTILKNNPLLAEVPEEARRHALRAELLIKEGNFSQAAIELKKAIQIAPYVPKLYYNSAQVRAEIKEYPEAILLMKTYLKVAADAPDVRKAKDQIIMWEFMMEKGQ